MHKPRTLMEHIHVLHKTVEQSNRQTNRVVDPAGQSDLSAMPDVCSDDDVISEFAGDALATLEDWETEQTLSDLEACRTRIH